MNTLINPFTREVLNHLGGKHDQSRHSGKGGGLKKLGELPRISRKGIPKKDGEFIKNPIKFSENEGEMELAFQKEVDVFEGNRQEFIDTFTTEETVQLDLLESGQKIVESKGVEHFLKNPKQIDRLKPPLVIQYKGNLIVRDGNTRISAQMINGEKSTKARVLFISG